MIQIFRRLILVSPLALLAGCYSDQKQEVATCRMEAQKLNLDSAGIPLSNPAETFMANCMASKGYGLSLAHEGCQPGTTPFAFQNRCYYPEGRVARVMYEIENYIFPD